MLNTGGNLCTKTCMITINLDACQITRRLYTQSLAKLVTSLLDEPFMKQGLDFVGLIKLTKKKHGTNLFLCHKLCYQVGGSKSIEN